MYPKNNDLTGEQRYTKKLPALTEKVSTQ